ILQQSAVMVVRVRLQPGDREAEWLAQITAAQAGDRGSDPVTCGWPILKKSRGRQSQGVDGPRERRAVRGDVYGCLSGGLVNGEACLRPKWAAGKCRVHRLHAPIVALVGAKVLQ